MRAVVSERYGGPKVLELREVPTPDPGPGEIRLQVVASSVSRTDCGSLLGLPRFARLATGIGRPKATVLGLDFAAHVEALGAGVRGWREGDAVFGLAPGYGAHAEAVCVPADGPVAALPKGLALRDAVLCEGAWYAQSSLDALGLSAGQDLLILGGGGAIGSAAVQLAVAAGLRVTAVVDPGQVALAEELGAERVIDRGVERFTDISERFDAVFDAVGKARYADCRHMLRPRGRFASTDLGPRGEVPLLALWFMATGRRGRVMLPLPTGQAELPARVARLVAEGRYRAVIDSRFPMEAVGEAYERVLSGRKTGIVALDIGSE